MWREAAGTFLVSIYQKGRRKSKNDITVFGLPAEF